MNFKILFKRQYFLMEVNILLWRKTSHLHKLVRKISKSLISTNLAVGFLSETSNTISTVIIHDSRHGVKNHHNGQTTCEKQQKRNNIEISSSKSKKIKFHLQLMLLSFQFKKLHLKAAPIATSPFYTMT